MPMHAHQRFSLNLSTVPSQTESSENEEEAPHVSTIPSRHHGPGHGFVLSPTIEESDEEFVDARTFTVILSLSKY